MVSLPISSHSDKLFQAHVFTVVKVHIVLHLRFSQWHLGCDAVWYGRSSVTFWRQQRLPKFSLVLYVFWVMILCSPVGIYQYPRGIHCLHLPPERWYPPTRLHSVSLWASKVNILGVVLWFYVTHQYYCLLYTHQESHHLLLKLWFQLCHLALDFSSPVLPTE